MNISIEITGALLNYLDSKVDHGLYKSRSEVVREAIREMIRKDLQRQLEEKGITSEDIDRLRDEVAGEIIGERYKNLA